MEAQPNIRLLKIVVIGLGVLILASLGAIVVGVAYRIEHRPAATSQSTESSETGETASAPIVPLPATEGGTEAGGFGEKILHLPPGARVLDMQLDGRHLALRVRLLGGEEQILLFNLTDGAKLGTFRLLAPAPTPMVQAPHPPAPPPKSVKAEKPAPEKTAAEKPAAEKKTAPEKPPVH